MKRRVVTSLAALVCFLMVCGAAFAHHGAAAYDRTTLDRALRAFLVARSRVAEDGLASAVAAGVRLCEFPPEGFGQRPVNRRPAEQTESKRNGQDNERREEGQPTPKTENA